MFPIYLDFNATTPYAPTAAAAMKAVIDTTYGNPSSSHSHGRAAKAVVDKARSEVASLIGASADEIIFSSGGTESNNHVILGTAFAPVTPEFTVEEDNLVGGGGSPSVATTVPRNRGHIITTTIEHDAVLNPCRYLDSLGSYDVEYIAPNEHGEVSPEAIARAIRTDTILVSVMHANNETGVIQPIADIARAVKAAKSDVLVHTDAAQTIGKIPVNVDELGVDYLTIVGHKIYASKGVGALYVRAGTPPLANLMHGAGHEGGIRPGTENIILIAGLGAACAAAEAELPERVTRSAALRDRLRDALMACDTTAQVNGGGAAEILPNTLSIGFPGANAAHVLTFLDNIVSASAGAACHSNVVTISAVLASMGVDEAVAGGTLRLTTGTPTTEAEIDVAVPWILKAVAASRDGVAPAPFAVEGEPGAGPVAENFPMAPNPLNISPRVALFSEELIPLPEVASFYNLEGTAVVVPDDRPYTWCMTVMTIDNVIAFNGGFDSAAEVAMKHIPGSGGGADWRLLNGGWMFADGILLTGEILRQEPSMYFAPRDSDMLRYRREVLGLSDWPLPIALTASGNIDTSAAILTSDEWGPVAFVTTSRGRDRILELFGGELPPWVSVCVCSEDPEVVGCDLTAVMRVIRQVLGIKHLDVTAGGNVISQAIYAKLVDEMRFTLAGQLAGGWSPMGELRPTIFPLSKDTTFSPLDNPIIHYDGVRSFGPHMLFMRGRIEYRHGDEGGSA